MSKESPGEEQSEDVKERLSRRFNAEEDGSNTANEENTMNADTAEPDQSAQSSENAWNAESVKDAWRGMTVYLPEELRDRHDDEYRRVDYELSGEVGGEQLRKDRHYKPLVIALGLERIEEMDGEELEAFIDRMERGEFSEE